MTDNILHIYLLGDLRITCGDEPVPAINSARAQSLLAYLVLHAGLPQSRRHLAFLLWPDSSDEQARSNLRKLVHDLRRALPAVDRFLDAQGPNLLWRADPACLLDVADFQRLTRPTASPDELRRALALYHGPLFQSCYDDWILPERERLHQLFIDALARLIDLLEQQADYRTAITFAHTLLHHDPLHEDVYRTLMRLYALTEDRAAALRTYQTCATVLRQELDVEPSPATQQAYDRLLHLPAPTAPTPALPTPAAPLVGHRQEWARLHAAWKLAAKGQPHWVLLSGAPGIGKTRLAEELVAWAAKQGIATASARCYAAETGLGYGPLTTWLRARPLPPLEPVWRAEIARLLPDLLVADPALPAPGPLTEPWQRLRFFEALARTLLATQPLLLFLDDLPFCDRDTLEWLHYVVRSNPQAALLLVSTLCLEDLPLDSPWQALFASLRRAHQLTEIGVPPLSADETTQLATHVQGQALPPATAQRLFAATEGNPLFILELLRAGQLSAPASAPETNPGSENGMAKGSENGIANGIANGMGNATDNGMGNAMSHGITLRSPAAPATPWPLPRTMHAVIAGRLQQLSPQARTLAQLAAVIGRAFELAVLAHASGLSDQALAQGLAELRHKRIVKAPLGTTYDFDHAQLAAVAVAELNPAERQLAHRRIAEALLALSAENLPAVAGEVVAHFEQAGLPAQALPYLVLAGDAARRRYANETAIAFYRQALPRLVPSDQLPVLLKLGAVLELVGQWRDAEALYRQALALAASLAQPPAQAEAQLELGELLHRQGWDQQAQPLLAAAQAAFTALHQPHQVAHALESLGLISEWQGDYAHALACHDQALDLATQHQDRRGVSRALGNQGLVYWRQGQVDRALEAFHRQFALAHDLADQVGMSRALKHEGLVHLERADYAAAESALTRALELATQIGDRLAIGYTVGYLGALDHARGNFERAVERYLRQLAILQELDARRGLELALQGMGRVYFDAGDYTRALTCYRAGLSLGIEIEDCNTISSLVENMAIVHMERGEERDAETLFRQWSILGRAKDTPYRLAEHLYDYALFNYRTRCFPEADKLNAQALSRAQQVERHDIKLKSTILASLLDVALKNGEKITAVQKFSRMLDEWKEEDAQAELYYELWRLQPDEENWRRNAARHYRRLYSQKPRNEYRRRYEELSGHRLTCKLGLPELPDITMRGQIDGAGIIAHVDTIIAERSQLAIRTD